MKLSEQELEDNIQALFEPVGDPSDGPVLVRAAKAFHRLVFNQIAHSYPGLLDYVKLDQVRVLMMIKKFYRDAFGVRRFFDRLDGFAERGEVSEAARDDITASFQDFLSVRINSDDPKKTRIAASFSLWMSTIRPVCLINPPLEYVDTVWHMEANINFIIARLYLLRYGAVSLGDAQNNFDDVEDRWWRIWNDFTYRDLTLSSLEFMYAGMFRPF